MSSNHRDVTGGDSSPRRDPHPELSAPIVNLSLEVQIARAEQRVKDRDARVRGGMRRIGELARSERGRLIQRAAIVGAIGLAVGAGYAGYKAWSRRKPSRNAETERGPARQARKTFEIADLVMLAQTAVQWGMRLHQEQGMAGSLFGVIRKALWPNPSELRPVPSDSDVGAPAPPYARDRSEVDAGLR
jgi:hypothetical protein